jgi:hypothetical protein
VYTAGVTSGGLTVVGASGEVVTDGGGVVDHCTMRGRWQLRLRKLGGRWLITHWAVVRTGPWERSPDAHALAAARGTPQR